MRQALVLLAIGAVLGVGIAGYAVAQEVPATPGPASELCASPAASPVTSTEASPAVNTNASPAAVATEVAAGIEGGLDLVVCATPAT